MDSFIHLHNHTSYSALDGAAKVEELVKAAAADGQPGIAITDHGVLHGLIDFYQTCKKHDINPILGIESYFADDQKDRSVKNKKKNSDIDGSDKRYYHLTVLAENNEGYQNLIKLSSDAFLEGFYFKSRTDWNKLEQFSKGLIVTSGCLGGPVLQELLHDRPDRALEKSARLQDIFGRDNFYIELQNHGLPEQYKTNPHLIDIARQINAPLIAANDLHYVRHEDAVSQDALLCCQTQSKLSDTDRFKFQSDQHYLKSSAEMRHLFQDVPDACDNTLLINDRVNVNIDFDTLHLPVFDVPEGFDSPSQFLAYLATKGLAKRYGTPTEVQQDRLQYELGVLETLGLSSYMLIVWDICRFADSQGIRRGPARGSVAGSLVAYCMNISKVDPMRHGLIFERFLNPSRVAMPDIDLDWDSRYRDHVINYTREKYGEDHVAQIITFSIIRARAAVRDSARVLGIDPKVADKVSKAMPPLLMGEATPLYACMERHERYDFGYKNAVDLREMYAADSEVQSIIDVALGLEGLIRQDGVHAAGLVISDKPITEYVPVQQRGEGKPIVTQYEKNTIEALGLLKMDYLGLKNLDVISETIRLIGEDPGVDSSEFNNIPTFDLLKQGRTIGVFQLESKPMRQLLQRLQPNSIDDIAAVVALYRPGPMGTNMHNDYADRKNGRQPVISLHPDLDDILKDTYQLMIYQEDMMKVAVRIAGYSNAESDVLRKACLAKGSKILTHKNGYVAIEDLARFKHSRVQNVDLHSFQYRNDEVVDVWSVGPKPVYKVTTTSGYQITTTLDHKFYVNENWKQLSEISVGDPIGVANQSFTQGNAKWSLPEVRMAALLISEGYYGPKASANSRYFCNSDPELLTLFKQMFLEVFGYDYWRKPYVMENGVHYLYLSKKEYEKIEFLIGGPSLSADKTIIDSLLNISLFKLRHFLADYLSCDGWIDGSGIHYVSKSEQVCRSIKRMLLRFGLHSTTYSKMNKDRGDYYWYTTIGNKRDCYLFIKEMGDLLTQYKYSKFVQHSVNWTDNEIGPTAVGIPNIILVQELERRTQVTGRSALSLGIASGSQKHEGLTSPQTANDNLYSEKLYDLKHGCVVWDKVKSIEYVGEVECFDFMMGGDRPHAFVEDVLVHNCGKKDRDLLASQRDKFIGGSVDNGYEEDFATKLFNTIENFGSYAFNKSHAYGYGYISYQTAFLKANYPKEYIAALCTVFSDELDKCGLYLNELREMGYSVRTPDINSSEVGFSVLEDGILVGLGSIKNIGAVTAEKIVEARSIGGSFTSIVDMAQRVTMNAAEIEAYAYSGALDEFGSRYGLATIGADVLKSVRKDAKKQIVGQDTLFDTEPLWSFEVPNQELSRRRVLEYEHNALGLYISGHPLQDHMEDATDWRIAELDQAEDNARVKILVIISEIETKRTKAGDQMAILNVSDQTGHREILMFPRTYAEHKHSVASGDVGIATVRIGRDRSNEQNLVFQSFERIHVDEPDISEYRFKLYLPDGFAQRDDYVAKLKGVLLSHHGNRPVTLHVGQSSRLQLPNDILVEYTPELIQSVRDLFNDYANK